MSKIRIALGTFLEKKSEKIKSTNNKSKGCFFILDKIILKILQCLKKI